MVTPAYSQEVEELKIDPKEAANQEGEEVEFVCTNSNATNNETLIWYYHNGTTISNLNMSRFAENGGTLKIMDIQMVDAGDYMCSTESGTLNATAILKVYQMPSYLVEGLVLMGINIALVLIFIACAVWRFVQTRRDRRKKRSAKI